MFMDITGNDLLDQDMGMAYPNVRLRWLWILQVLIYLIKMWYGMCQCQTERLIDITGIDLFDQNVGMTYAEAKLRCSWISLVLIS